MRPTSCPSTRSRGTGATSTGVTSSRAPRPSKAASTPTKLGADDDQAPAGPRSMPERDRVVTLRRTCTPFGTANGGKPARAGHGSVTGVPSRPSPAVLLRKVDETRRDVRGQLDAAIGPVSRRPQLDLLTRSPRKAPSRGMGARTARGAPRRRARYTSSKPRGAERVGWQGPTRPAPTTTTRPGVRGFGVARQIEDGDRAHRTAEGRVDDRAVVESSRTSAMPSPATSKTDGASSAPLAEAATE